LTFEEVNKCADTAPLRQRKHKFLSTTQLEISNDEDVVCWESSGAPAGSGVGGGIGLPELNKCAPRVS
jgi:hypothetical protein